MVKHVFESCLILIYIADVAYQYVVAFGPKHLPKPGDLPAPAVHTGPEVDIGLPQQHQQPIREGEKQQLTPVTANQDAGGNEAGNSNSNNTPSTESNNVFSFAKSEHFVWPPTSQVQITIDNNKLFMKCWLPKL